MQDVVGSGVNGMVWIVVIGCLAVENQPLLSSLAPYMIETNDRERGWEVENDDESI